MTRSEEQLDREIDRMWERLDTLSMQMATLTEKTSSIETAIKTMAESTGRAMSNMTLCAERGVELAHTKERITKLEQSSVDHKSFERTITDLRKEIQSIKKLLGWTGAAIALPLVALAIQRIFG